MLELALTLALTAGALPAEPSAPTGSDVVAIRAGSIHLVQSGQVLDGGQTILVRDGKIEAVGGSAGLAIPPDARVVDYGPDAVIVPGFIAPMSTMGSGTASDRTADPAVRAIDNFDFYSRNVSLLASGVTAAYMTPTSTRLVGGQGAVVKLGPAGDEHIEHRVLADPAAIHGSITSAARSIEGYWEPPIPPTADVGMGGTIPQLPATTMGAIVALEELITAVKSGVEDERYGPTTSAEIAGLMRRHTTWNFEADTEPEIRALLGFARRENLPMTIIGAAGATELAAELEDAGIRVVVEVPLRTSGRGVDAGKDEDSTWPSHDAALALFDAGVTTAIAPQGSPRELRLAAALLAASGVDEAAALRAITLTPAEMYGIADRVGTIEAGKDADFVVLNGAPLALTSSVMATWIGGESMYDAQGREATVLEVDELHVGDGEVLAPGQLLIMNGRIVEVGTRVAHPPGAVVVRGTAAMPGIVDAFGHLGLEGSSRVPNPDFRMSSIVSPGDDVDRRVAERGITTVVMAPRGPGRSGAPIMAYKPAASEFGDLVVLDPAAMRMQWSESMRSRNGESVRDVLEKAAQYDAEWREYEQKLAEWTPTPPTLERPRANIPPPEEDDEDEDEEEDDDEEDVPPTPTGVWEAEVTHPGTEETTGLRLQLLDEDGAVRGSLRSDAVSENLVRLTGTFTDEKTLELSGDDGLHAVTVSAEQDEEELTGKVTVGGLEIEFAAERTSTEYVIAGRSELRRDGGSSSGDGKPNPPKLDEKLEPFRRALAGDVSIVVDVQRDDDIVECVETFAAYGIEPVLFGAPAVTSVDPAIRAKIRGVIPTSTIAVESYSDGFERDNAYARLQRAGLTIAFASHAEEGAIDLPRMATFAVANGMSPTGALRALTYDAARIMAIDHRVGRLAPGLDADVLLLSSSPLGGTFDVQRVWVNGEEVGP